MNKSIYKILILISATLLPSFTTGDVTCGGKERWDIKNLTDAASKKINFIPDTLSIELLSNIMPGRKIGRTLPRFGIEFKTYVIKCDILEYRKEDDGDYHLVLASLDDSTKTMVGEIPNPLCHSVKKSKHSKKYEKVRENFENNIKSKGHTTVRGKYLIYGVAFYDKIHHQLGVAPNGIELHPILSIKRVE